MKKILLCPPTFYDIEYEINPWMHVENKVDKEKVIKEYEGIKATFESLGVNILEIEPVKGLPDMVYAANFGFVKNDLFIKSNFRFEERQGESIYSKKFFQNLNYRVAELPENIYFEGQGDLLPGNGKYFMGYGKRTSFEAKEYLEKFLEKEIIDLQLSDPYFYHLDMSFVPLDDEAVLINEKSFDKNGLDKIYNNFKNIIIAGDSDNKIFACNAVVIDRNIVIGKGISQELKNNLGKYDFKTHEVTMIEYGKGGGSVKCLTLEFF